MKWFFRVSVFQAGFSLELLRTSGEGLEVIIGRPGDRRLRYSVYAWGPKPRKVPIEFEII